VKQEERWVVDGPAGCVGPKGQAAWLFVQGWGERRRGSGRLLLMWLRPKVAGKVFLFSYYLSSYLNYDSNLNLEFEFEPHSNKIQNKSNKIHVSHTSSL
jgi:hypothetical protein